MAWNYPCMTPRDEMARFSARLGLMNEPQDWGIVNADSGRLEEFVHIYESEPLTRVERSAMAALVLASANERLEDDPQADLAQVASVLPRIELDAAWELEYWRGLDGEKFPVGGWLRGRP